MATDPRSSRQAAISGHAISEDATGGRAGAPVASSEMAWPEIAACLLLLGSVAIGEGPQERDDGLLLRVRQSELAHLGCVHVFGHFWRRPSRAGNVPRVIEVHDFLERLEVAVVAVGLDEARIRPLVHVAQGGAIPSNRSSAWYSLDIPSIR